MNRSRQDIQKIHHTPHAPYSDIREDPFALKGKPDEPAACPDCKAVFQHGHWQWLAAPLKAAAIVCPACHRIRDKLPAGYIQLDGAFLKGHQDEIVNLIRHEAEYAGAEHPLQRIMDIEQQGGSIMITTTDIHLARRIGEAVKHAYQGELQLNYKDTEDLIRIHWSR